MILICPHLVKPWQQLIQRGGQGLFRVFLQKIRRPLGGNFFGLTLLAQDVGHALEGLGSLGKASLTAEGSQGGQTRAAFFYLCGTRAKHGVNQQGVLPLTHEIVAQPGGEKFHQLVQSFGRGQFPLPVAVQFLRFGENLAHVQRQAEIQHNAYDAQGATAKAVGVCRAGGDHAQAEAAREGVGLVGQ